MSGPGYIAEEPVEACELCGTIAETRPYGPNYERICFECGMKNEELTKKRMFEYIHGEIPDGTK